MHRLILLDAVSTWPDPFRMAVCLLPYLKPKGGIYSAHIYMWHRNVQMIGRRNRTDQYYDLRFNAMADQAPVLFPGSPSLVTGSSLFSEINEL